MTTMNISLSEKMKNFVQSKVESGDYNNASEYVRDLIRQEERKTWALSRLQDEIQKGYESGAAIVVDDLEEFFEDIDAEVIQTLEK